MQENYSFIPVLTPHIVSCMFHEGKAIQYNSILASDINRNARTYLDEHRLNFNKNSPTPLQPPVLAKFRFRNVSQPVSFPTTVTADAKLYYISTSPRLR